MAMYVITHKQFNYKLPADYRPLLVGASFNANPADYLTDNTGSNISAKNKSFCELTGLYWMWKNTNDKYIGLSHYRRYFSRFSTRKALDFSLLITGNAHPVDTDSLNQLLKSYDWVVSQPERGGSGTVGENFAQFHHKKDLDTTRQVIKELTPQYIDDFDKIMASERDSFYNMFYTSRSQLDHYCQWLFQILFEVEKRVDISNYDIYQQRLFGFLAERLFNVWLLHNKVSVKYLAVYQTDIINRKYAWHQLTEKIKQTF